VPASSYFATRRVRRASFSIALATVGLIGLLACVALAKGPEGAYPGATLATRPQSGWQRFSMKVEEEAPGDEAQSGITSRGTPVNKRGEECFPTYEGNLFSSVDLLRGADGKLSSVFDKAKAKPDADLAKAIRGQNTWILWSEGDEAFWGWLQEHNYGFTDFLVLLDSREREHRFRDAGLVNQPEMKAQKDPAKKILGLYLDQNTRERASYPSYPPEQMYPAGCPEPFTVTSDKRYRDALHALATDGVNPDIYGYPSGVVGLRLFPNPDFFAEAETAKEARAYWKVRVEDQPEDDYYRDREITADPKLVRPFRIGMTCAFCHIGPHPLNPPQDPEDPDWENLSSTIGAQYWNGAKAFSSLKGPKSFFFQLVQSWQPGTLDTSLISTDQLNNPIAMNAIWDVPPRLDRAMQNPPEGQSAANLLLPSIEDPLANPRHTPRVLMDGADSVGISGALSRVYLNIGAYYQQWLRLHNPVIGFRAQRPFEMATISAKSVYWRTTEKYRVPEIAAFLTYENKAGENVTGSMKLANAPERKIDSGLAAKGRAVFIENCAICHSSKQPRDLELKFDGDWKRKPVPAAEEPPHFVLPMNFKDWDEFKLSDQYREYKKRIVDFAGVATATSDPFLERNYLSTDIRVPVTLVGTNSSRAVGTNAMKGQVWDNFSSDAYKKLPAVGAVPFYNPYSGAPVDEFGNNDFYYPPAGGPGYYRPASLVGVWATAPFLHNNALGRYTRDPSLKGRLDAFDDAVEKLFSKAKRVPGNNDWPDGKNRPGDLRLTHPKLAGHDPGFIYRTTTRSWIDFPATFIRQLLVGVLGERWTSILTRWLWYVLAGIAILFAFFGRQQHAGFTLVLIAVIVGAALRVTGIDTIYPSLWWIPAVAAAAGLLLWFGPRIRIVAPLFFAVLGAGFLVVSAGASAWVDGRLGGIKIGPLPEGTPVDLIMNLNPQAPLGDLVDAVSGLTRGILRVRKDNLPDDEEGKTLRVFEAEAGLPLLKASKCPDFVLDRGHWFAEGLSEEQKSQLKEFLKTL
jgi:hypothetical protein